MANVFLDVARVQQSVNAWMPESGLRTQRGHSLYLLPRGGEHDTLVVGRQRLKNLHLTKWAAA